MNHREKLRQARREMTKKEIKAHVPPFQSKAWETQKEQRAIKILKKLKINKIKETINN